MISLIVNDNETSPNAHSHPHNHDTKLRLIKPADTLEIDNELRLFHETKKKKRPKAAKPNAAYRLNLIRLLGVGG